MKAKTVNQLIKEFCQENSYDESIEEMLYLYWKHARKLMVQKENPILFMVGLGEFSINRKKLIGKIKKTIMYIESLNKRDYCSYEKYSEIQDRLSVYQTLLDKAIAVQDERRDFRLKQNDPKIKNDLEE